MTASILHSGGLGRRDTGPPEWVIFWLPGPLAHYNKLTKFRNV